MSDGERTTSVSQREVLPETRKERDRMLVHDLLLDIHALEEELLQFERKYGIRSETFYAAYAAGEEPENEAWMLDFGEWASVYRTWLTRQAEYRDEIHHLQSRAQSLSGLIRIAA